MRRGITTRNRTVNENIANRDLGRRLMRLPGRPSPSSLSTYFGSLSASLRLCGLILLFAIAAVAQSPTVEKVDPPNWWTGMTLNPVRVLLQGTNLKGASLSVPAGSGLTVANLKASENGHYLFFDLTIGPRAKQGRHKLILTGGGQKTNRSG